MDEIRAWRHTFGAVQALSLGAAAVGERLCEAYFEHLRLISPNPGVPAELQAEYHELMGRLQRLYPSRPQEKGRKRRSLGDREPGDRFLRRAADEPASDSLMAATERALYDLYQVIAVLSGANEPLAERLGIAYWTHLTQTRFDNFPEHQRTELESIQRELARLYPERGKHEHVDYMQAFDLARRILCAYDRLFVERSVTNTE